MDSQNTVRLRVPKQDLVSLTFDGAVPKKMTNWVESLPKVNVGESSRQLYSAIQELNRFKTDPKNRFLLLEELRNSIHYVCKSLGKHFLNQSIVLNEKESKVANLAQALQNHLAIGYKIVVLETLSQKTSEAAKLRTIATHRALTELSGNLLRCFQLYFPTPPSLWQEIHQLYSLADYYGILHTPIPDEATKSTLTIEQCYFKTMLLSTARPNQLRQNEIAQLSLAFNIWAEFCELQKDEVSPFIVDIKSDQGALYSQWNKDNLDTSSPSIRYVHLNKLVDIVRERLENLQDNEGIELGIKMLSPSLLRHLVQSWSASSKRAFARTQTEGKVSLSFGLGAVHHFISDGKDFSKMLMGGNEMLVLQDDDNPFLSKAGNRNYGFSDEIRSGGDVWSLSAVSSTAKDSSSKKDLDKTKAQNVFAAYQCDMVDTSPGGYCLQWNGAAPPQLKTGEIICIREPEQDSWSVGVVRWMKKTSSTSVRLGLELLAPHAEAVGAKVIHKDGATTEYMRAIRLPELQSIGQPSTIITPQLTFKTGYKVLLNVDGEEIRLQLLKEIGATASFSQFEYKLLGGANKAPEPEAPSKEDDEFNSLWTSI
jgi:hypothetical protein